MKSLVSMTSLRKRLLCGSGPCPRKGGESHPATHQTWTGRLTRRPLHL